MTNAVGQVPKFGLNRMLENGESAPKETEALWNYSNFCRPEVMVEVHSHFTRPDFTRSVGLALPESMPERLQTKARALRKRLEAEYVSTALGNRFVLLDMSDPVHRIYGDQHYAERLDTLRVFLQAIPDSVESTVADVRSMVETVAESLFDYESSLTRTGELENNRTRE